MLTAISARHRRGVPDSSRLRRGAKGVWAAMPYFLAAGAVAYLYLGLGIGQVFNEDYAVYLQQAWNIAHHLPMNQMGVIQYFDPDLPLLLQSPLTYPPLLPIIYAFRCDWSGSSSRPSKSSSSACWASVFCCSATGCADGGSTAWKSRRRL